MSLQIVQRIRAPYPTPLWAQHGRFLLQVAGELGLGLVRKSWGTFVTLPDGTGVSQDCVMHPDGRHWDILGDGENMAIPAWQLVTEDGSDIPLILDRARFYAVAGIPQPQPPPPPPPPAPAPAVDLSPVLEKLAALEAQIAALKVTVEDERSRPFPEYTARFFGQTLTLKPVK